jgi:hypothetical protein
MQQMRRTIREHNIYEWAGNLIAELCELRLNPQEAAGERTRIGTPAA